MKKSRLLGAACTCLITCLAPPQVNATTVIDFESVADGITSCLGGPCAFLGTTYVEDGFQLTAPLNLYSFNPSNINFTGSKALLANSGAVTLTKNGGGVFALNSIDLSEAYSTGGTVPVNFTGVKADASVHTVSFNLDTFFGNETFTFSGWDNLVSVSWEQEFNYHQFDNIVVSAVPIPPALWLFGSGLIGLVGIARRKQSV